MMGSVGKGSVRVCGPRKEAFKNEVGQEEVRVTAWGVVEV